MLAIYPIDSVDDMNCIHHGLAVVGPQHLLPLLFCLAEYLERLVVFVAEPKG